MLKCIAIDDEPLALRQLTSYISKIPYLDLVAKYNNALEAQQMLAGEKVDLIFVDINMPDLNGVDFVRALIDRPMVIFTTAYSEYAVEGFKLDAVDYLLKPFSFADFSRSAAKANSLYKLRHNQRPPQEGESEALPKDKEYISVKADYKVSLVKISDIVYLESEGEYVRMHLADGTTITTLFRLKNMETGASFGVVHARAPFVHRQPAHDQGLRQRAHLPQRHGVRTDWRELQGSLPGIYRQEFPKFVAIRPGGDQDRRVQGNDWGNGRGKRTVNHRKDPGSRRAGHTPRRGIRSSNAAGRWSE